MINKLKAFLNKFPGLVLVLKLILEKISLLEAIYYNKVCLPKNIRRIKKKIVEGEKINVVFSAWNISMWKYHSLYSLMSKDSRFNPIVVLCPSPGKNIETKQNDLDKLLLEFRKREYNLHPVVQWNDSSMKFAFDKGLRKKIDILFPTQQYTPTHLMNGLHNYIICFSSYGFHNIKDEKWGEDTFLCQIMWMYFVENQKIKEEIGKIARNNAQNRMVTGYIYGDEFVNNELKKSTWKNLGDYYKKIIWAPHFSIETDSILKQSNFLLLSEDMLKIAEKYKDKIQIAFKPHPFLYDVLCRKSNWGKEKTDKYYASWEELENGQLEFGEYVDLFKTSDAIIHDCGSFVIEYLYIGKPALYISKDISKRSANETAEEAIRCHYIGKDRKDIERFIEEIVIADNDYLKKKRQNFYKDYLLPPNGKSAAENAFDCLKEGLGCK